LHFGQRLALPLIDAGAIRLNLQLGHVKRIIRLCLVGVGAPSAILVR
jgi:hypothetical protein